MVLRVSLFTCLYWAFELVVWFAAVGGSGTNPLELSVTLGGLFVFALFLSISLTMVRRTWVQVLLVLFCLILELRAFGTAHYRAFEAAKEYGALWAACAERQHSERGIWPGSFQDIPPDKRPAWPPAKVWPYPIFSSKDKADWFNIGGFFISYRSYDGSPVLYVGRRETQATWDRDKRDWIDIQKP